MDEFSTDRCLLNLLTDDDRDDAGRLYANRGVRRFLGGSVEYEEFSQRFEDLRADASARTWVVRLKSTHSFAGIVGIDKHHDGQEQQVSFQLMPEFWGKGYACEVVGALIEYAAFVMKLTSIIAETQCANYPSRKLLARVGMVPVRTLRRCGECQIIYRRALAI